MSDQKTVTVQEILDVALKEIEESYILSGDREIINSLNNYTKELRGNGVSGKEFRQYTADELSRINGSVALMKEPLSEILARYNKNVKLCDNLLTLQKGNQRDVCIKLLISEGKKVTEDAIKQKMEPRIFKLRMKLTYLEEWAERVLYLWRSVNSVIDVVKQRIDVLQRQQSDTRLMEDSLEIEVEDSQEPLNVNQETGEVT